MEFLPSNFTKPDSTLSRNFLVIAPNIIVLDRLRADFDGLRIFFNDPILPQQRPRGPQLARRFPAHPPHPGRRTRRCATPAIFSSPTSTASSLATWLTRRSRTTTCAITSSAPFGPKPVGKTTDSKTDLGEIVREVEELAVFNDEAHHIHNPKMAWFKSIQDIHHQMLQKDRRLALQVDVTATPRHDNGAIFVQTVSDYPLVEAIHQNVVKHPVLPDAASRAKLHEHKSAIFTEKYDDYLKLGIEEWRKSYAEHEPLGKKAVLFVMVDDTRNCDDVGAYLEKICPELQGRGARHPHQEQRRNLRSGFRQEQGGTRTPAQAVQRNRLLEIALQSHRLRPHAQGRLGRAQRHHHRRACAPTSRGKQHPPRANLGRGLRRMYFGTDTRETVSVMGTPAFMEFVESIQSEGVTFEHVPMGGGTTRQDSLIVEVDTENPDKNLDALDIPLPKLTRRFQRDFKDLDALDPASLGQQATAPQAVHAGGDARDRLQDDARRRDSPHHPSSMAPGLPTTAPSSRSLRASCSRTCASSAATTCSTAR